MAREILFKAKRLDNGEWVIGCLLKDGLTGQHFIHAEGNSVNESDKVNEEGFLQFVAFEVDESTICRYTGLTDKNGNKIWENDVVTFPDCEMSTESGYGDVFVNAGKVAYDTESMSYFFTNRVTVDMGDIIIKEEVEVIGNIFDNPELLEKQNE